MDMWKQYRLQLRIVIKRNMWSDNDMRAQAIELLNIDDKLFSAEDM